MLMKFAPADVIEFGKHKGRKLMEIAESDPGYIAWMIEYIPAFFVSQEDIFNLMLLNYELKFSAEQKEMYQKKKRNFEIQYLMMQPSLPMQHWNNLSTTSKNFKIHKRKRPIELTYEYRRPGSFYLSLHADSSWEQCKLGVNHDGEPVLKVYGDLMDSLGQKPHSEAARIVTQGMFIEEFSLSIQTQLTMDEPGFGAFAYRLAKLGLLTY